MERIRNYNNDDFTVVLNLLNNNKEFDCFTKPLLEEKLYQDPSWNPKSTFIAEINNNVIGFLQGIIRDINTTKFGFVKLMVVDKGFQRQGIANRMYLALEQWFMQNNIDTVRIYDSPLNYFMPGIDPRYTPALCFVEKMGFKRFGETCNLLVDLTKSDWDTDEMTNKLSKEKILVSRANKDDKEELLAFISNEWKLWLNEIETAYKADSIAIHIARQNGKIKAFSAHNGNNIGTAWFGPMGTQPDLRGKGIGQVLLYKCLKDMKNMGFKQSIIPWVGPIAFYSNYADAKVDRVFWRYEKKL